MQFQPMFNIWEVPQPLRRYIQPGQWVFAGDRTATGRFMGSNGRTDVVAWKRNARGYKSVNEYNRTLRTYAQSLI